MNVLVIGGNRFFGKTLVHQLIDEGSSVWVLNRGNTPNVAHPRVHHVKSDREDTNLIIKVILENNIDIIYDQICFSAADAKSWLKIYKELKEVVPRLIVTSTQSVYKSGIALAESDFSPYDYSYSKELSSEVDYGEAKRQAEACLFQSEIKDKVIAVRFPIVLGADDYTGRFLFHINALKEQNEVFIPNPDASISFISSNDAAKVLKRLAVLNFKGPLNACAHRPIKISNFLFLLENYYSQSFRLGLDPHKNYSPYGIGRDWWMDTDKLKDLGIYIKEIPAFLVEELNKIETRESETLDQTVI